MIALYAFISLYCPSCGTLTRLDRIDNALSGKYQARQALSCPICGVMFQLAAKIDLLRAATASGGDYIEGVCIFPRGRLSSGIESIYTSNQPGKLFDIAREYGGETLSLIAYDFFSRQPQLSD